MKKQSLSLLKKLSTAQKATTIKVASIAGTATTGAGVVSTAIFSAPQEMNKTKESSLPTTEENELEKVNPELENPNEEEESAEGGGSGGGGGGSGGGGGGGGNFTPPPQPSPAQIRAGLFNNWLQTDEAKSTYETWRTSKEGVEALKTAFAKSDQFKDDLTSWSRSQKREKTEFKEEALKSDTYKERFKSEIQDPANLNTLKDFFINSKKYNQKKQEWIDKAPKQLTANQWYQTGDFTTAFDKWKAISTNQGTFETKWKLSNDYQVAKDSYLAKANQKLDKDNWLSTLSGQKALKNWEKTLDGKNTLINSWKSTQDYQDKLNLWINVYPTKKTFDDFKNEENIWNSEFENYKTSNAGNQEIENAITNKDQYINAKNAWSDSGKSQWSQTNDFATKYNAWRTSDDGRNILKPNYLTTNDYSTKRDQWLLNDYTNKRSKDAWSTTNDAKNDYNTWKADSSNEASLKTYWQNQNDYTTKQNAWINAQQSSKSDWASTSDANQAYDNWKQTQAGENKLKTHYQTQGDFVTKRDKWIADTANKRSKTVWIGLDDSNSGYDSWRVTSNGRSALKPNYLTTNDYSTKRDQWLLNDYTNKRSKDVWSTTDDAKNDYSSWKADSSNETSLKAHWQNQNDYTTKQNAWINAQQSSKSNWASTSDANQAYDNWKQTQAGTNDLKTHYQTQSDFASKRDRWIIDNTNRRDKTTWLGLDDSTTNYDSWRVSDDGRNALKSNYLASNDYITQRNHWLLNDYTNKRSGEYWVLTPGGLMSLYNWSQNQYTEDDAKTYWKTINDYTTQKDLWITNNKPDKTYWSTSDEAKASYNTYKADAANSNSLENAWKDANNGVYTAKRDSWIAANPIKRGKNTWINLSASNSYYNSWRVSAKGISALSPIYFKTQDYQTNKDNWIANNYQNKRTQNQWNNLDAAKASYKKWETSAGVSSILKAAWETKDDYTTKRDEWIANNKPAKDFWKDTQHAIDNYSKYKTSSSGENALKTYWEGELDYITKRDTWITNNDAKRDMDYWSTSSFGNSNYVNWTQSSEAFEAWKTNDTNNYETLRDTWFNTNFPNIDTLDKYKENEYSNWKTQQGVDALKSEWEATPEFLSLVSSGGNSLDSWINGHKKPTIRSWILQQAARNTNDFITLTITRANNTTFSINDRIYLVVKKVLETFYSDSSLTTANATMYAWNGATGGGRDYKNFLNSKLMTNSSLAANTFLGNFKKLWIQKNNIDATNSEYISHLKTMYKMTNQDTYDREFETWAKAKWLNDPSVANKDFSAEYLNYKESKFTENSSNYQSEFTTWLTNNNTGLGLFKATPSAIAKYNSWFDPKSVTLYKNDFAYQNDYVTWRDKKTGDLSNGFNFYLTQPISDTDYGNWTNPSAPKRSYDYWKKGNFNNAYNQWKSSTPAQNLLDQEFKKTDVYQKNMKSYWLNQLETWKQSPEARAIFENYWKKSNNYNNDKESWLNSELSNTAYNTWKNTPEGQKYLKAAFMASPGFKAAMEDWFDHNDSDFNEFKHNWFYNEYKTNNQSAFEDSLKNYYKTTEDFTNKKNIWWENNKPTKAAWRNHVDFADNYNNFVNSTYGSNRLKDLFYDTSTYRRAAKAWSSSSNATSSKEEWIYSGDFDASYSKWKVSEAGIAALKTAYLNSAFYQQRKAAYVASGVSVKRDIDWWVNNSVSNSAYNTWKTTEKAKADSEEVWEATGDGPHYFERSLNYWWNNFSTFSSSQSWTLNRKKELFKLSTNATYNYKIAIGNWLNSKSNGKNIFKTTAEGKKAYDAWNDPSPVTASNSNYDTSAQFLSDLETFIENDSNENRTNGHDAYIASADATTAYNDWDDVVKEGLYNASADFTTKFNTFVDDDQYRDLYFNEGVADYDYNLWRSSTLENDYVASNEFAIDNRNHQVRLKEELDDFILYFNNNQSLVNSWVDSAWDTKIKELYLLDSDFTSDFNTWSNDKSNGLEIYKKSAQATSDYQNHSQYQKDLDTYKWNSNIGKSDYSEYEKLWKTTSNYQNSRQAFINNNLKRDKDFWLNSADSDQDYLDWKNSRNAIKESFSHWKAANDNDYATKRDEWFKNNLKDMDLTSLENEWKQSTQYTNQESKYWGDFDSFVKDSRPALKEFITAKFRSNARTTKNLFTYGDNTSAYYSSTWQWMLYVLVKSYFPSITSSHRSHAYHGRTNASANLYRSKFYDAIDNDSSWDDYTLLGNLKNLWLKNGNINEKSSQYQNWYYGKFYNWLVDNNKIDDAFKANKYEANINNYEGSLRTWLGDKDKSKDLFKASTSAKKAYDAWDDTTATTAATESDYTNGNYQYEKDFSTWYNAHKFYLNESTDWENTEDYKTKRAQWASDQNYTHQTKAEWFNSTEGQKAYNDFKANNTNLEMFKNYYKTTQDYTNNKDAWVASNVNAKENWTQSTAFATAFNNYVNDSSNQADLKAFWKTTQDYADSKNQWIGSNYPGITKAEWRKSQDFKEKYLIWKNQVKNTVNRNMGSSNRYMVAWQKTQDFIDASYRFRTKDSWNRKMILSEWADSIYSHYDYRKWVNNTSNFSDTIKNAWEATTNYTDVVNQFSSTPSSFKRHSNYKIFLRIWLLDNKNVGLDSFESSSIARSGWTAFKRTSASNMRHVFPEYDYWYSEMRPDLKAWFISQKNEWLKMSWYFFSNNSKTDFANYQSSFSSSSIPNYDTDSQFDTDFNDFKSSLQMKNYYLNQSASDTAANTWNVTNGETKYNDSNSFNSDLANYQDASQANGYSNLENYYLGLDKVNQAYEDHKAKKLDEAFKASSEYQSEMQKWQTTNNLTANGNRQAYTTYENQYLADNVYNSNLASWVDTQESDSTVTNGEQTYIDSVYDDNDYNSWKDNGLEPVYKSNAAYQSDFEAWRDKETNGKSNGFSYYLNHNQATTDYNAWIDPNGEPFYKNSVEFTNHINLWSSTKSAGINTYKADNQSNTDYQSWNDPSPLSNDEAGYQASATYQSDFAAWKDDLTPGANSGFKHYIDNDATSTNDYNAWTDPDGETNYQNSPDYQNDFVTWRDGNTNGQANLNSYYLSTQQGINDYNNWVDIDGEDDYQANSEFNNDLDNWSSDKTKGIDVYKADSQSDSDYNNWMDPTSIFKTEADYLNAAAFVSDFETWRDKTTNGKTNGYSFYLTNNQATSDYNNWIATHWVNQYQNDATYQSDFETWRDKETNSKSNGYSFYLNQNQSTSDYNNWVDLDGENDYQASNEFANNIDNWSSDKTKGIDVYKTSAQSDSDYQSWVDPSPTVNNENDYLNDDTFVKDFEAWRDKVENNQINGLTYFLTQNQATSDYNNWIATHWVNQYQNDATYQSDFEAWRDKETNSKSNGYSYYLNQNQATSDYNNWVDLDGENDYKASNEFTSNLDTWSQGENSNKNHYLNSNSGVNEWKGLLDAKFAQSNQGQTLMNNLKLNYGKEIYKTTNEFQQYYNNWTDPNIRTSNKYQLHANFISDYDNYYANSDNKKAVFKTAAQSDNDYNVYLNNVEDENDYLNSASKNVDLSKWINTSSSVKDMFKNNANTLTLFQNFNNQRLRNEQKYLQANQFVNDLKVFVNLNSDAAFEKYLTNNLDAWYQAWNDPTGITPNEDVFKNHNDYSQYMNKWSAIMANGLQEFMISKLAQSAFDNTQK